MSQAIPPPPPTIPYGTPGQPMMGPTRTSAAAVTSLICGILGCFIVTGIVAIITGIIGLRATRDPNVRGRGLAIAGLVLGAITTIGGASCLTLGGYGGYMAYKQYGPAVASVSGFVDAASDGDVDRAMTFVDESQVPRTQVESVIEQLRTLGEPTKVNPSSPSIRNDNGIVTVELGGTIDYPNNVTKQMDVVLLKQPDGMYKLTRLDVR